MRWRCPPIAASAFYHHKLPQQPAALEPFLKTVEEFALGEYMSALLDGSVLTRGTEAGSGREASPVHWPARGLSTEGQPACKWRCVFENLQDDEGITTGRLDTRYQGPDYNPLSEEAEYDPQSNAVSSAYMTAINQYLRTELKYGENQTYKPTYSGRSKGFQWDLRHQAPGGPPAQLSENGST